MPEVEATDEFGTWHKALPDADRNAVYAAVERLQEIGVALPHPLSSQVKTSRHGHLCELRIQSGGKQIRIFYAFDPRRVAILLSAGIKRQNDRFYREHVHRADAIYDAYIRQLKREGLH